MLSVPYVAGFFDGEGSVGVYRTTATHYGLRVQVTQNDTEAARALLEACRERWGGNIGVQTSLSGRPKMNWQTNGDAAAALLRDLLPHLVLKREQAAMAVAWQEARVPRQRGPGGHYLPRPESPEDRRVHDALKALKRV